MIAGWVARFMQGLADPALLAELETLRQEKRQLESDNAQCRDRIEQLETQVEFMMQTHEVNINLLNRMNATHGFGAAK